MQNFILNLSHAGYGGLGLILFLYINLIYEIVNNLLKINNHTKNYALAFIFTILFAYLPSFLGKFGSLITLIAIFIYLIKILKNCAIAISKCRKYS